MTGPSDSAQWQRFEALRKYKEGKLWKQLNEIEPGEIEFGLVEFPQDLPASTNTSWLAHKSGL